MLELNKIYNMDCMEGMAQLQNESVDIIITSPPYNLGKKHHTGNKRFMAYISYNDDMPEAKYQEWQISILNECYRVLKNNGSLFYNHKNRIRNGEQITPYEWIFKTQLLVKQELVWFNRSQNFDKIRFYPMTERVYWLTKSKDIAFKNEINHHDLFEWQAVGTNKVHKRAFPIKMVQDLLSCFPSKGTVLDPFAGSGTVAIAACDLGFDFIGFEIDKEYFEAAQKRIDDHKAQISFDRIEEQPEQIKLEV